MCNSIIVFNLVIFQTLYGSGYRGPSDFIRPVLFLWRRGGHHVRPLVPPEHPGVAVAADPRQILVSTELVAVAQSLWSNLSQC